ncbi:MAG: gliding motility-associated C-terminal domain-containing protein [Saprospiraceae bacterium]|nr:gliding motility-associated C-terminal domain-containing protein [Saprospiraceae bacterium]
MKIFNEWGVRVFTTTLPQILWNGKDEQGKNLADGSYYYHCTVYVKSSEGLGRYKELKGYINILR